MLLEETSKVVRSVESLLTQKPCLCDCKLCHLSFHVCKPYFGCGEFTNAPNWGVRQICTVWPASGGATLNGTFTRGVITNQFIVFTNAENPPFHCIPFLVFYFICIFILFLFYFIILFCLPAFLSINKNK